MSVVLDWATPCLRWRCHELTELCRLNKWWSSDITYSKLTSTSRSALRRQSSSWLEERRRRVTYRRTGCVWAPIASVKHLFHIAICSHQTSRFAVAFTEKSQLVVTVFSHHICCAPYWCAIQEVLGSTLTTPWTSCSFACMRLWSPSSIIWMVLAKDTVAVNMALHWPCVTDSCGMLIYKFIVLVRDVFLLHAGTLCLPAVTDTLLLVLLMIMKAVLRHRICHWLNI